MPVTPTYPGVYIEELPSLVRTIMAVSTSVTAFVGYTPKGPVDRAVTITSFADYERRFGGLDTKSPVSYAVQQFFLNGGAIGVIVRVASGANSAAANLPNRSADPEQPAGDVLTITAKEPGLWGNGVRVAVDYATATPDQTYNLRVFGPSGTPGENYPNLSADKDHPRYAPDVVNSSSALITVAAPESAASLRPDPTGTVSGALGPDLPAPNGDLKVTIQDKQGEWPLQLADMPKPGSLAELALALEGALRSIRDEPGSRTFGASRVTVMGRRLQIVSGSDQPGMILRFSGTVANLLGLDAQPNVTAYVLDGGVDGGLPAYTDLIGNEGGKSGIYALRDVDDVNLLCLPEVSGLDDPRLEQTVAVLAAAGRLCQDKRMFLIADSPASWTTIDHARANLGKLDSVRGSYTALYFPHLELLDPLTGRLRSFPPCGAIAGIMARTDTGRGVWKAPAGTEARLAGTRALTVPMTDPEHGLLNPLGVNCLRSFPVVGPVVWGARTLDGADALASQWKYVPVRRLALMLEESLYRGTKWVVFEPNDEPLWAQIRLNVGAFMHTQFERGAFQGTSARDAYFVKCDKDTTTQNDVNSGIVNILVGFAPLKPAEFVIIKIEQLAGQIEV